MAEQAVVNVRGEITEHGGEDQQQKIVKGGCGGGGGDCNGAAAEENEVVNGDDVGGKIHGDVIDDDSVGVSNAVAVAADGDSVASDLVAVINDNGDGTGVVGESDVTVLKVAESEAEAEAESDYEILDINNKEENDCTDASAVSNGIAEEAIREKDISNVEAGGENADSGSVAVLAVSGDLDVADVSVVEVGVKDVNKIQDHDHDREIESVEIESAVVGGDANGAAHVQIGVENEIHGDASGVTVADANGAVDHAENEIHSDADDASGEVGVHSSVQNEIHGDSNGVTIPDVSGEVGIENGVENEIHDDMNGGVAEVLGDEKDDVTVVTVVADDNKSIDEFESVAVENGLAVESDVPVVIDEVSATDVEEGADKGDQTSSGEKEAQIESMDSGGGDEKDDGTAKVKERSESVSDTDVNRSLECENKNIVSSDVSEEKDIVTKESEDREFLSAVVADVQNGLEDTNLSECAEKNAVSVDVDDVSATTDVEERADKHDQNGLEKAQIESATDVDVEKTVVGEDAQNGLAEPELSECSEAKLVSVEDEAGTKLESSEETAHELVLEAEKFSALSSTDLTADDNVISDLNSNGVESNVEPSAEMSESKNIAEVEPSTEMSESKNIAVESKVEPSAEISDLKNIAVEDKAEPSNNAVESEGEPFASNSVKSETEPGEEDSKPTQEGSSADSLDGQNVGSEVVRRPFYYLIRLPRYDDDENIKEQIDNAFQQVDEKTKLRDLVTAEINNRKATMDECRQDFGTARSAERAARDLLKSKRQEMDAVQSTINRLTNAISVGDIDNKIRNMEYMIQHETLPLKEEKQLIRQIKQLKQNREELSSIVEKQDQSQQSSDQNDSIEEHYKRVQILRKEVDLLRNNVQKAETATTSAKKKSDDEFDKLSELQRQFNVANGIRQEAYFKLKTLKNQLHEKNKYFWEYRNAVAEGQKLAVEGKKEELQCFCIDQVERIMELWNKNDEFRRDYVRCNTRSTVRRFQTLDGRALGPDEQPPVIPNAYTSRASKNNSHILRSTPEQEKKSTSTPTPTPTESVILKDEPVSKVEVQKTEISQTSKAKKPAKRAPLEKSSVAVSRWGDEPDEPEDMIKEPVRTKEEEELILKAEKARKEEEEAKLKEKRRLEEIEKAKEAMERKRRQVEKVHQRAALKAQKEAEQKEKEREKRQRKKERRKAAITDNAENTEQEPAPTSETLTRSTEEIDQSEKPAEVTKRPQKPSQFTKQTKSKSVPLPLRNRGKRRIQPWMWWALIAFLVVVAMFYLGNNSSLRSWLQGSGF